MENTERFQQNVILPVRDWYNKKLGRPADFELSEKEESAFEGAIVRAVCLAAQLQQIDLQEDWDVKKLPEMYGLFTMTSQKGLEAKAESLLRDILPEKNEIEKLKELLEEVRQNMDTTRTEMQICISRHVMISK